MTPKNLLCAAVLQTYIFSSTIVLVAAQGTVSDYLKKRSEGVSPSAPGTVADFLDKQQNAVSPSIRPNLVSQPDLLQIKENQLKRAQDKYNEQKKVKSDTEKFLQEREKRIDLEHQKAIEQKTKDDLELEKIRGQQAAEKLQRDAIEARMKEEAWRLNRHYGH